MKIKGWDLSFFNSGEWQVCDERLKALEKVNRRAGFDGYNPGRQSLFEALQRTPLSEVRVCILGQDPYPTRRFATGTAFEIPASIPRAAYPPTLKLFFQEYHTDLGYDIPGSGEFTRWAEQGVLLWNAIPSCRSGESLSHDWDEWSFLTREIVRKLSDRGIVFALLGQVAKRYLADISTGNNQVILTSHPSPRGNMSSKSPFTGSRLFSTINAKLVANGQDPIDWRLS